MSEESENQSVGLFLCMIIIFIPYFGAWFTLRDGYSLRTRVLAFSYMVLVIIILILMPESVNEKRKEKYTEIQSLSSCELLFSISNESIKTHPQFCSLQENLLRKKYSFYSDFLENNLCNVYYDLVNRFGTREDVRRVMLATYAGTAKENSREAQLAAGAFTHCENQNTKDVFINERLSNLQIYSIGDFVNQGVSCVGFLVQETGDGNRFYQLWSHGECGEISLNNMFHPTKNPKGRKISSFYKDVGFTGSLPTDWMWHNKVYQF